MRGKGEGRVILRDSAENIVSKVSASPNFVNFYEKLVLQV